MKRTAVLRGLGLLKLEAASPDPAFAVKAGFVGLYLDPPDKAVVLVLNAKPGTQALGTRTPSLSPDRRSRVPRAAQTSFPRSMIPVLDGQWLQGTLTASLQESAGMAPR